MSAPKRPSDDQDPDYLSPGPTDAKQQKIYEETARANTANKIIGIVEREFSKEIDEKEKEVLEIQNRLHKALKTLHLLRYVVITDFYNRKQCQAPQAAESKQTQIHPAIKRLIGKTPRREKGAEDPGPSTSRNFEGIFKSERSEDERDRVNAEVEKRLGLVDERRDSCNKFVRNREDDKGGNFDDKKSSEDPDSGKKIPRYIPPRSNVPQANSPSRGVRHKVRKRIVVGNISKWIPPDWREDGASHKWMMYVRGSKDAPDIADFVSKVRFFLHPSYQPNDVVQVVSPPFHLSRRGWGEFPLRVQLHFKNSLNKPMDIIHYLKLDRTYTGLQTLGSETVVDIWIHAANPHNNFTKNFCSEIDTDNVAGRSDTKIYLKDENSEIDLTIVKKEGPQGSETLVNQSNILQSGLAVKLEPLERRDSNDDNSSQFINENCIKIEHNYTVSKNFEEQEFSTQIVHSMENNVTISHSPPVILKSASSLKENTEISIPCEDEINLESKEENPQDDFDKNLKKDESLSNEIDKNEIVLPKATSNGQHGDISELETHRESDVARSLGKNLQNGDAPSPVPIKLVKCNDKFFFIAENGKFGSGQVDLVKLANSDLVKNILAKKIQPTKVSGLISSKNFTPGNTARLEFTNGQNGAEKKEIDSTENFFTQKNNQANKLSISNNSQQLEMQKLATSLKSTPSKSEPLRITIPPPFEATRKKQILLLKNNKLISVNAANNSSISAALNSRQFVPRPAVNEKNQETKTESSLTNRNKVSLNIPEGTSLLKPSISILKKPVVNNVGKSGMILKINPSNSLLLNSNSAVPALQIATFSHNDQRNLNLQNRFGQMKLKRLPKNVKIDYAEESKPSKVNVTLGKDKQRILSKREIYEDVMRSIETVKINDPIGTLGFIMRRVPLVTEDARDSEYRQMHPYACSTQEEFLNFHLGKQRAHEWYRAKMVRSLLKTKGFEGERLWSVREILNWARVHGFTPMQSSLAIGNSSKSSKKLPDTNSPNKTISTCTESLQFNEWMENCKDSNVSCDESDVEVDVVHVADKNIKTEIKTEPLDLPEATIALEVNPALQSACAFVNETAREIGIKLQKEEIIPGVADSTAERMISQAMKCLVDDLVRRSLAKAWERNGNKCPDTIMLDDVRGALSSREEFDVFTNEGLGSLQNSG